MYRGSDPRYAKRCYCLVYAWGARSSTTGCAGAWLFSRLLLFLDCFFDGIFDDLLRCRDGLGCIVYVVNGDGFRSGSVVSYGFVCDGSKLLASDIRAGNTAFGQLGINHLLDNRYFLGHFVGGGGQDGTC